MIVTYYDELGVISVIADSNNIIFFQWEIYFDSNGEEYRIPLKNVIEISKL